MKTIALCVLLSILPLSVFAAEPVDYNTIAKNQEALRWSMGQMCYAMLNILTSVLRNEYVTPETRAQIEFSVQMIHDILETLRYE